jgi:hypothetical protein
MGQGIQVAGDLHYAFGYAHATRGGGQRIKGLSDHYWPSLFSWLPRRAELRVSPVSFFDVGGDIGWLDGGVDARAGIPDLTGWVLAAHIAGGIRSGRVGPFKDTQGTRSTWARLELYPRLFHPRGRLALAFGVNHGVFFHEIAYDDPSQEVNDSWGPLALHVLRRELRLEATVGYHLEQRSLAGASSRSTQTILFALEPYVVADAACVDCRGASYRQSFGLSVVVRGAIVFGRRE